MECLGEKHVGMLARFTDTLPMAREATPFTRSPWVVHIEADPTSHRGHQGQRTSAMADVARELAGGFRGETESICWEGRAGEGEGVEMFPDLGDNMVYGIRSWY